MTKIAFVIPKYKIFHSIPWNSNKNIGKSYNETMNLVGTNDWICFLDGDAVHTTSFFGIRIEETVAKNPQYSLFTCYTNRIGCQYQIAPNVDKNTNDQEYHRNFGENMWNKFNTEVMDVTKQSPMSGVLLLVKKSSWESVGGFKEEKMLSVDNDIHIKFTKHGFKSGLMKGIYVQHWYRGGDINNKKHLQ